MGRPPLTYKGAGRREDGASINDDSLGAPHTWTMPHESAFSNAGTAAFILSRQRRRRLRIWPGSLPLREQLVANVTRGWGQANASRLTPCGLVDLFLITDSETTGRFVRDEYSIAHLPARSAVPGFDLFPEPQPSQLELRKLLSNFPPQAIFFGFAPSLATSRKHPQTVTSSSYQQYTPAFCCNEFR